MRLFLNFLLLALLTACAMAAAPQKPVIVSYPNDTPNSVLDEAKNAIKAAGGVITHEYNIIKGFAAKAPAKALETIQALGAGHNVLVEEDQVVHINN